MTADTLRAAVDIALKQFGRYSFSDKGAHEVMDLAPILNYVKSLPASDARALLEDVAQSAEPMCALLVQALVSDLDDQPQQWWDALMESDVLSDMY